VYVPGCPSSILEFSPRRWWRVWSAAWSMIESVRLPEEGKGSRRIARVPFLDLFVIVGMDLNWGDPVKVPTQEYG